MTRFARSKGSKSSNERLPNEATPWHVMKEQLEISKDTEQANTTKTKSAKELLADKQYSSGQIKTAWAEFENSPAKIKKVKSGKVEKSSKAEKKSKLEKKSKNQDKKLKTSKKSIKEKNAFDNSKIENSVSENVEKKSDLKEKKIKRKNNDVSLSSDSNEVKQKKQKINLEDTLENTNKDINNTSKKKKRKHDSNDSQSKQFTETKNERNLKNTQPNEKLKHSFKNENEEHIENNSVFSKRQKRNQKKINNKNVNNAPYNTRNDWNNSFNNDRNLYNRFGNNIPRKYQRKVAKVRDDREHTRRKPDTGSIQVTINGMDIEIVKYDGFPILKKDAERLRELRKEMVLRAIPKNEIDAAMKLERRKCEKALARIRKQVCFHCRKAGHNLSECPELEKEEISTGICFKCGSTEHTHFECKVNKSDEYRFAKCFICREQGHIAKQCPDNPKGLYPDGGSCKICGDVTHLKKDCPDLVNEKEETTITLDTINDNALETLDIDVKRQDLEIKKEKVVRF